MRSTNRRLTLAGAIEGLCHEGLHRIPRRNKPNALRTRKTQRTQTKLHCCHTKPSHLVSTSEALLPTWVPKVGQLHLQGGLQWGVASAPPLGSSGGPLFYWPFCCPEPLAVPPGFLGGSASPFDSTASCAFCNSPSACLALRSPSLLGFAQHFCMHSGRLAAAAHAFLGHPGRLGFPVPPGVAAVRSSCRRQAAREGSGSTNRSLNVRLCHSTRI